MIATNSQSASAPDEELEAQLEERADYIPLERLESETAVTDFYGAVHRKLVHTGTKLLSGPRGCGKTHLMRYTYLQCVKTSELPLAVYASFNRYYRLEPLLREQTSAIATFHTWMLAVLLRGLADTAVDFLGPNGTVAFEKAAGISPDRLNDLTARIDRRFDKNLVTRGPGRRRKVCQRRSSVPLIHIGQSPGECRVVVGRDLVLHIIAARIRVTVGGIGTTD